MSQLLHILKKDVRYLRNEIGLLLALCLFYAWTQSRDPQELLQATGTFTTIFIAIVSTMLIGLVIQAEAIPGDKQFWITRPYRWPSLLAAKLLFIFLFVNLPVFIGRVLIVAMDGIPLRPAMPALLSSQAWLLSIIALPTAAVAALTPGLTPFIFSIAAVWFVGAAGINLLHDLKRWPRSMDWVHDSVTAIILIAFCSAILYLEYKSRRTWLVRVIGSAAIATVMLMYRYVPLSFALDTQTRISTQPAEASPVNVTVTPKVFNMRFNPTLNMEVAVAGVPSGYAASADVVSVTLQGEDSRVWNSGLIGLRNLPSLGNTDHMYAFFDPDFAAAEHDKPLTLTASVYLTIYVHSQTKQITFHDSPTSNVFDDLVCSDHSTQIGNQLRCLAVSALSNSLISVRNASEVTPLGSSWISFAPLSRWTWF